MEKPNILTLKTSEGYVMKIIAELYKTIASESYLIISKNMITIAGFNRSRDNMVIFGAKKINFDKFICKENKFFNLPQTNFYLLLKPTRRKDGVEFHLNSEYKLKIVPIRVDTSKSSEKYIELSEVTPINIKVPRYNDKYLKTVTKAEFQRMIKDIQAIPQAKQLTITSDGKNLVFKCSNGSIGSSINLGENSQDEDDEHDNVAVEFSDDEDEKKDVLNLGDMESSLDESKIVQYDSIQEDEEESEKAIISKSNPYKMTFHTNSITRLGKIAGSSKNVSIYISQLYAIKFRFYTFTNAIVDVCIKSKEILER